jgi:hypothetical protein
VNKVSVILDEQALLELQQVLLDDDPQAALAFVKRRLAPKLPGKGSAACDSSRLNPFLLRKPGAPRGR